MARRSASEAWLHFEAGWTRDQLVFSPGVASILGDSERIGEFQKFADLVRSTEHNGNMPPVQRGDDVHQDHYHIAYCCWRMGEIDRAAEAKQMEKRRLAAEARRVSKEFRVVRTPERETREAYLLRRAEAATWYRDQVRDAVRHYEAERAAVEARLRERKQEAMRAYDERVRGPARSEKIC